MKVEEPSATVEETPAPEIEENKVEELTGDDKPVDDIKEATPEPESAAKPKKEKVKKKWSFRSISFGKKDKQKPSKKDKKNEENKAVAEGAEDKLAEEKIEGETSAEEKPVEEKPQVESRTEATESKPLETVAETVVSEVKEEVKPQEEVKPEQAAPTPKPVAVVEPVAEKIPEPEPEPIIVPELVEEKIEAPVEKVEEPSPVVEEKTEAIVEEIAEQIKETTAAVEEILAPAIPTTPPPSQFSVFAEQMNTNVVEETLPEVVAEATSIIAEIEVEGGTMEIEIEQVQKIDVEPVAAMVEKVLEQAVDHIEAEIVDETAEDDLPPPPLEELAPVEEVTQNGIGQHTDEPAPPAETVKVRIDILLSENFMSNRSS